MQLENNIGSNDDEICNLFANFFQNVYTTHEEHNRDYEYFSFLSDNGNNVEVTQLTVNEILKSLECLDTSKGPGPDGLPPAFIKPLAIELTKPLFWIFNLSLKQGVMPSLWKKSFLIPIYKTGKKSDIKNYRGIAIISCIPKLFEAIVNEKIFAQVKHSVTSKQHGFFKGRSTTTNLLEFTNFSLNVMGRGNYVEALYTDFSKAFDRIDIKMLLFKLERIGFQIGLLKWIESYLTDRTQYVKFNNCISNTVNVTSGVPQGSHLGPLLFILFVNDVTLVLNRLKVLIYADDMKLYMEIGCITDVVVMQNEIDEFYKWCEKSLLELNVKKCNCITLSRKQNTHEHMFKLGHQVVKRCDKIRDLGVILDSKITFVEHYNYIIHKASNMLGFIKRFSYNFNDPYTIKTLFVAYVRSILEYCSVVWSPYHAIHEERIESVQKQFILFALRKLGWTSYPLPSYKSRCMLINIESLKKRREFALISFMNDLIMQRIDSAELLQRLNFYAPIRLLRSHNLFCVNQHRTVYAMNGPINKMMNVYNVYSEVLDITFTKQKLKQTFYNIVP